MPAEKPESAGMIRRSASPGLCLLLSFQTVTAMHPPSQNGSHAPSPTTSRFPANPMKILLAGGAGYVGSALVPRLLDRGYEVTVLDLFWFGNHLPANVPILEKDILSIREDDLRGYDQ